MLKEVMPSGRTPHSYAVEIGLCRRQRCHGRGDRRVFVRPVEPGAREQPHGAMIEARMYAVAVELDFVQPLIAFWRRVDELGQLQPDPLRQNGRVGARLARYRPRHAGNGKGLRGGA
jgi:hypothetical protein